MWKRNWFWVIIATVLFSSCYLFTVGTKAYSFSNSTRIHIFENSINVPNWYFFFAYLPFFFFFVFLVKSAVQRLKNRNANKILVFFNSFLIVYVTYLTLKINWINETNNLDENTIKLWQNILHISLPIQVFLISVLVIVSWKGEKKADHKTLHNIG